jgi:hypothetical protein
MTDFELIEQSFQIAWSVLERSGELGGRDETSEFLLDEIMALMRSGQRHRLMLSNLAIDAYRHRRQRLRLVS